jgi:hypothetical protein
MSMNRALGSDLSINLQRNGLCLKRDCFMKVLKGFHVSVVAGLVAYVMAVHAGQHQAPSPAGQIASKPVHPALVEVEDVEGLPRVLLIGDSISMGYTRSVRARLKGVANVHRPPVNCGDTARGLSNLDTWLGEGRWSVIHFNFGLHDLKYTDDQGALVETELGQQAAPPEVYRRRLREVTQRLKATGAKVIFATTTPVPPGTVGRVAGDEKAYNAVALDVMKELSVPINDLCAHVVDRQREVPPRPLSEKPTGQQRVAPRPDEFQLPFDVHFTAGGYDQLADQVATCIKNVL